MLKKIMESYVRIENRGEGFGNLTYAYKGGGKKWPLICVRLDKTMVYSIYNLAHLRYHQEKWEVKYLRYNAT